MGIAALALASLYASATPAIDSRWNQDILLGVTSEIYYEDFSAAATVDDYCFVKVCKDTICSSNSEYDTGYVGNIDTNIAPAVIMYL